MSDYSSDSPPASDSPQRFAKAASALMDAIAVHSEALLAEQGDIQRIFEAGQTLLPAALAYADAQLSLTGNAFPFGALESEVDDETDLDEEAEGLIHSEGISIIERHDYLVVDKDAVLNAGRLAYRVREGTEEEETSRVVDHLGVALYELAHDDGWRALANAPGLRITGAVTVAIENDDVLIGDPDDWPEHPGDIEGEALYRQEEIY
jgi:hypothetical protein